ncbi:MAG: glutamine--tRNA ligase/YqeY domain fusion protein [Acidiferrobacterales bacterium]|nr:glutamine--tRNA ligase/YqeY domain fusion protein [Acidiferrobacterales bacterium]
MNDTSTPSNFIRQIIDEDMENGKHEEIITRFPPEPNGYLHIGHAKSIWLNFGIARDYGGKCTLRFDDTNPVKEDIEFVEAIEEDVRWLGYEWSDIAHASDYFDQLYRFAVELIEKGLAYVDSLPADQIREYRGTLTEPGKNSPDRDQTVADNLALFEGMRKGEYADGERVLRAKIDMASPNINLRDPVIYRIRHHDHQRTGNKWCIYPMYDFTHGLSDAIEGVTHSLCTLEFEDHRPLYNWFIDNISAPSQPRQIEFSRLNLNYTVMSKRLLTQLVESNLVGGWDDPRMPTISGLRRRGFTPASVNHFISQVGITKKANVIDMLVLENAVREDLDPKAPRAMAVLKPLKVILENYPEDETEAFTVSNHPKDESLGKRTVSLSRTLYIDQDDFMEDPPAKFFRLGPGRRVRLRNAFVIECSEIERDQEGNAITLRCKYLPETRNGKQPEEGKVKGIIHWVNAADAVTGEVRLYDRLFQVENPLEDKSVAFTDHLNDESLITLKNCKFEASLAEASPDLRFQFERVGYFYQDPDSSVNQPVFNRIVTLRDSWANNSK